MYVSAELIAIVATAIALGTATLASIRSVRQEVRDLRIEMKGDMKTLDSGLRAEIGDLRGDMKRMESGLRGDMKDMESGLRGDMQGIQSGFRGEMRAMDDRLRDEMKVMESGLRDEMKAGFKDLASRVVHIGDRLSRVEGIIEGMFWGARNQPADKPGEGAA